MHVSIIIPALNEEKYLPGLLESIERQLAGPSIHYEVLLADNGSVDHTRSIAEERGAEVIRCDGLTVGAARNRATEAAGGEVLIFLDADMLLLDGWWPALQQVLSELRSDSLQIVGGSVTAPPSAGWIGRAWFPQRRNNSKFVRYVGSGHMITSRRLFDELGGFSPHLRSGEDYELCQRALANGARVHKDHRLAAYHLGVPATLSAFVRRELWHGSSGGLRKILGQRVSWVALGWLALHMLLLGLVSAWWATGEALIGKSALGVLATILSLAAAGAVRHSGADSYRGTAMRFPLYYIYYWTRAIALLRTLLMGKMDVSPSSATNNRQTPTSRT
jgi:GT2 family glycosyltransferase